MLFAPYFKNCMIQAMLSSVRTSCNIEMNNTITKKNQFHYTSGQWIFKNENLFRKRYRSVNNPLLPNENYLKLNQGRNINGGNYMVT